MKTMKIMVLHENGKKEPIMIEGPAIIKEGKLLNILTTRKKDFYFTKDGYYDGWGKKVENQEKFLQNLNNVLREIED